ncbi:hypothetical protein L0Y59_02620 [Candidatus Uhrbacteria bacterium]|nr:hypothetical protein [Candidatus Uhrbacteria bacterium]
MTSFRSFLAAATILAACAMPLASHAAVSSGTLIKGASDTAVYYVDAGKRYAFPNERVYFSWYHDFSTVVTVPDADLATYALAGNVTYRPASRLVKVTTDPRVYAVSRYGTLRWVMAESVAVALYGTDWNTKVDDLPDAFFTNYLVGSAIGAGADYDMDGERGIATIGADIRPPGYVPPVLKTSPVADTGSGAAIAVTVSVARAVPGQQVVVAANVSGGTSPIRTLDIMSDAQTVPVKRCADAVACTASYVVADASPSIRFSAIATDAAGTRIVTPLGMQASLTVLPASSDLHMNAVPNALAAGSRTGLSSDASRFGVISSHRVYAAIPGEPNSILWKDCGTDRLCSFSTPVWRTTQFYSAVANAAGTTYSSAVTVTVTGGEPPKPTLTVVGRPAPSQATMVLTAPSGETIGWSTIVEGTTEDDLAIALCELASCELTVQVSKTTTFTGFTDVGGKLEASNSVTVAP